MVEDRRLNRALLYNYGYFSFSRTLLVKLAWGGLFWVGADAGDAGALTSPPRTATSASSTSPEQRVGLARALLTTCCRAPQLLCIAASDNCATRPRAT